MATNSSLDITDYSIGDIVLFCFDYAPKNWMPCAGQKLNISEYQALFALIGTKYGGDGVNTFALPNLKDAIPVSSTYMQYLIHVEGNHPLLQDSSST